MLTVCTASESLLVLTVLLLMSVKPRISAVTNIEK